jgi:hypothetical protein
MRSRLRRRAPRRRPGRPSALDDVVAHTLPFLEAAEALAVDRRVMHEHIGAAVFRGDEPETLCVVEPLHGAVLHNLSDLVWMRLRALVRGPPRTARVCMSVNGWQQPFSLQNRPTTPSTGGECHWKRFQRWPALRPS